jgi:hypothetical protein
VLASKGQRTCVSMTRIPKILHYCFGMAADFGGKPWSLIHFVSVASAIRHIKPEAVYFYYEYEPSGAWWDLTRPIVTPVKIEAPREIFGRSVDHPAHRADVVRLQKLKEHGGIYLDADVLVQRSFDDLLDNSTVLGSEGFDNANSGMANAIILAEPGAPFIKRWLNEYRSFRGSEGYWNEHSVVIPARLAREYPDEITVLAPTAFFWPLWTDAHIEWLFGSPDPIPKTDAYAHHLWESFAWQRYLVDLTPRRVRAIETNFHRWARPYLEGLPDDLGRPPMKRRLLKGARSARSLFATMLHGADPSRVVRRVKSALGSLLGTDARRPAQSRSDVFNDVYRSKSWGDEEGSAFFSGLGSRGRPAEDYVREMTSLLKQHEQELGRPITVIDIGCGDFEVGRALVEQVPALSYIGCDIVPPLIEFLQNHYASDRVRFQQLDVVEDRPPSGDVCLIRQVFQHLSNADISKALQNLGEFRTIYVTEGQPEIRTGSPNPDKPAGFDVRFDWRRGIGRGVELAEPPFSRPAQEVFRSFAPPHEVIVTERS